MNATFPDSGLPTGYLCPLCLSIQNGRLVQGKIFHRLTGLTREHVPPHNYGGKRLVLTCRDCNETAGHSIDAELGKHVNLKSFFEQNMRSPRRYKFKVPGITLDALVHATTSRVLITNWSGHPEDIERAKEKVETLLKDQGTFQLSPIQDAYKIGWPEISLLRAAYLVAFAKFGYRYALREVLEPVRQQIGRPQERILPYFYTPVPDAPDTDRILCFVHEPVFSRALMIQMGKSRIFLPFTDEDGDLYDRLAKASEQKRRVRIQAKLIPWPERPEHVADFYPNEVMHFVRESIQ